MGPFSIATILKWFIANILICIGLVLPYRLRVGYIQILSWIIHFPFRLFGKLGQFLLNQLEIQSSSKEIEVDHSQRQKQEWIGSNFGDSVAILFSGGTDSTCTAALLAEKYKNIHLLTYFEKATQDSPIPTGNVEILRAQFPHTNFIHSMICIDDILQYFSYQNYFQNLRDFGRLNLATCGFSSLSWHLRTLVYCVQNRIPVVADGLTRELMHFPGHMDEVNQLFQKFYHSFGVRYINPVREWPVPQDQQFIDRLILNRHTSDFFLGDNHVAQRKTTGLYLFEKGIFKNPNMKGARQDFLMQHDCYPFALYNILTFWVFLPFEPYSIFCQRIKVLMAAKISMAEDLLREFIEKPHQSILSRLLGAA